MNEGEQVIILIVPFQGHDASQARGEFFAVLLELSFFIRIELPDAGAVLEYRAGVQARGHKDPVIFLTGIGGSPESGI